MFCHCGGLLFLSVCSPLSPIYLRLSLSVCLCVSLSSDLTRVRSVPNPRSSKVRVFVSRFGMPDDLRDGYDADGHRFVRASDNAEIAEGTSVRLRLIGVRCYAAEINATGTITNDYLGIQGA